MLKSDVKRPLDWFNVFFIAGVHLIALFGFVTFSWQALIVALVLWWITGGLGVTLGLHRLLAHRAFVAARPLKCFLAVCGTLAVQGGPIAWVAGHRVHHAHSDKDEDPHNSRKGFWWSHIGWIFYRDPEFTSFDRYKHLARDVAADPFIVFLDRNFVGIQAALGVVLFLMGGWSFVIWGIFVRLVFGWHCTWLVNSATHMFGYQSYESLDESRNCWWIALITFGEGWHNNHHAFPRSARHGLRWWEFDSSFWVLKMFEAFGWAWDLHEKEHLRNNRKAA
jgi:stearoyl-CoA desaturase (delta-9 desaturase)